MFVPTFVQFNDLLLKSSLQYSNINILLLKGIQKLIFINLKHSLSQALRVGSFMAEVLDNGTFLFGVS
jgi:hypothetical protein